MAGLTLVDFARFQDIVQFDLADSPAITQLRGDSQYGALYDLMSLLLAGNIPVRIPPRGHSCVMLEGMVIVCQLASPCQ